MPEGGPIFDGFLLTSTNGNTPLPIVDVPMMQMPTQTEVAHAGPKRGIAYRRPDSDAPGNRFRLYEVAGMPHNNSRDSPAFRNDPCTLPVTDFPAGAFTAVGLNHLIEWIANGKTPPHAPPIAVDQDTANDGSHLALDELGNAKGGVRNVWVDVPIATYGVFGKGKTTAQDRLCQLAGTEVPHSRGNPAEAVCEQERVRKPGDQAPRRARRRGLVPPRIRGSRARRCEGDRDSVGRRAAV